MSRSEKLTGKGNLIRLGFTDIGRTQELLEQLGDAADPLVTLLGRTADPDQALEGLVALAAVVPDRPRLLGAVADDEGTAMRTLRVLGASVALTEHLLRHPEQWVELTDPLLGSTRPAAYALRSGMLEAVGASPTDDEPVATLPDAAAVNALRVEYRRVLLRLAARDLAHHVGLDNVAAELSDLAAGALEAGLAIARARLGARRVRDAAFGDRHGQVWWTRTQLRLRRRRDLRLRTRRGRGSVASVARRHPTRDPPDPDLF